MSKLYLGDTLLSSLQATDITYTDTKNEQTHKVQTVLDQAREDIQSLKSKVNKVCVTKGDTNTPIYFSNGEPTPCTELDLNTSGSAAKLATPRTVQVNLESENKASFDGSSNITPGVNGILPVKHGGTGSDNILDALKNLGLFGVTVTGDSFETGTANNKETVLDYGVMTQIKLTKEAYNTDQVKGIINDKDAFEITDDGALKIHYHGLYLISASAHVNVEANSSTKTVGKGCYVYVESSDEGIYGTTNPNAIGVELLSGVDMCYAIDEDILRSSVSTGTILINLTDSAKLRLYARSIRTTGACSDGNAGTFLTVCRLGY